MGLYSWDFVSTLLKDKIMNAQRHLVALFSRESYSCQPNTCTSATCDIPMLDHVRRIINSSGAIYISLRKLPNCVPGGEKALMMWNWCRKCRQVHICVEVSLVLNLFFFKISRKRAKHNPFFYNWNYDLKWILFELITKCALFCTQLCWFILFKEFILW